MQIITGPNLSKLVDYSFGDHHALWDETLIGGFMKYANANNREFLDKAKEFEGKVMTLYIDNIRLYPRNVKTSDRADDKKLIDYLFKTNNLLALCSLLPSLGFIIFTGQEDTPIDEPLILPFNVIKVYAVNALVNSDKVIPLPFGLQRQLGQSDNRLEVMQEYVDKDEHTMPSKLLYINCGIERNEDRKPLAQFETNDWVTTRFDKDSKFFPFDRYRDFLNEIKDHKFMVCPPGHGMDCHRNWESLYMRRVPIMKDHPYFRRLMSGFPVLFVNEWSDITQELLLANDHLFQEAQEMDMSKLDLQEIFNKAII